MNVHLATNEFIRETFDLGESSFGQVPFWGFNSIRFGGEMKKRKNFLGLKNYEFLKKIFFNFSKGYIHENFVYQPYLRF